MQTPVSRRVFLLTGGSLAAGSRAFAQSPRTIAAGQIIDRIKDNVGVPWRAQTVDNIIAGTPETPVHGVATTMMATLDVLKRAASSGRNMVITHESTFFSHEDRVDRLASDPTYQFKLDFITKNQMVVFHFHDHWHALRPMDGIHVGMTRELGWDGHVDPENPRQFIFRGVPLAQLAKEMQTKLKIRVMRVVGDPRLTVRRAFASWGNVSLNPGIPYLARPDVDALILGETHEWELVEYAQDAITSGARKALIILGHVASEQAGMKYCADWLRPLVPEVPVEFIAAAEPYWSPDRPVG